MLLFAMSSHGAVEAVNQLIKLLIIFENLNWRYGKGSSKWRRFGDCCAAEGQTQQAIRDDMAQPISDPIGCYLFYCFIVTILLPY